MSAREAEQGAGWRKASRSMADGNCVKVGSASGQVLVGDTADRGGTVLSFTAEAWAEFTARTAGGWS